MIEADFKTICNNHDQFDLQAIQSHRLEFPKCT